MEKLDRRMQAYLALQDLDLTYEILGHIVQSDSRMIGIITEAQAGRPAQYSDRDSVYRALALVQQCRLVLCGVPSLANIHILHGQVRLTDLCSIWYFLDCSRREEAEQLRHWEPMEELYAKLKRTKASHVSRPRAICNWSDGLLLLLRPSLLRSLPYSDGDRSAIRRFRGGGKPQGVVRWLSAVDLKRQGLTWAADKTRKRIFDTLRAAMT